MSFLNSVLRHRHVLESLSWREIEDIHFNDIVHARERRCTSRRGVLNISAMGDDEFRGKFRFTKDDLETLRVIMDLPECVRSAQNVPVSSGEALCIALRRHAYPNRLCDLESVFGRHSSTLSSVSSLVYQHIDTKFGHLLDDVNAHRWLDLTSLERFSRVRTPGV